VGNKGCVAYSFILRDRAFNFIACHLKHGQENEEKRNKEASQILKELKFSNPTYKGLECDSNADFTFFFGDLNYRTNSTFDELDKDIKESMNPKLDQLHLAMKSGHYPEYREMEKSWLPTYKLHFKEPHVYLNKKDQSQSYTDRILYKQNSCDEVIPLSYEAYHDVMGSDHRPVCLTLLANLPRY